jgi:hypothetical protein
MIELDARIAIGELMALYGHVIDERDWPRMHEIFTEDAVFDASDFGSPPIHGRDRIAAVWASPQTQHPVAHHATNIVITEAADGTVRVLSKGLGVGPRGRVGSIVYRDIVRLTAEGWRIAERIATLRRP